MKEEKLYTRYTKDLLLKYGRGTISPHELHILCERAKESPALKSRMEDLNKVIALQNDIDEYKRIDVGAAYNKVLAKVDSGNKPMWLITPLVRYAAAVAIIFMVASGILGTLYYLQLNQPITFAEVSTPTGTIAKFELPDRSTVWLNGGSKMRYPTRFTANRREIALWGEGYFEVEADKTRPFSVLTQDGSRVTALGTKFNVKCFEEDNYVEAVLKNGKIDFVSSSGLSKTDIAIGERVRFGIQSNELDSKHIDVDAKIAWRQGKLIFRDEPLHEVLKQLSRRYNVHIRLNNPSGKEYLYRATFRNESITQILDYLKITAPIEWAYDDKVLPDDDTSYQHRSIAVIVK